MQPKYVGMIIEYKFPRRYISTLLKFLKRFDNYCLSELLLNFTRKVAEIEYEC